MELFLKVFMSSGYSHSYIKEINIRSNHCYKLQAYYFLKLTEMYILMESDDVVLSDFQLSLVVQILQHHFLLYKQWFTVVHLQSGCGRRVRCHSTSSAVW